jgi:hypothetical protein
MECTQHDWRLLKAGDNSAEFYCTKCLAKTEEEYSEEEEEDEQI